MADRVEINMSRIKIAGVGGLGMLAMVGVVAYAMPEARQFVLLSYGAGTLGAFAVIAYRRWIRPERPHRPTLMTETRQNGQVSERIESVQRLPLNWWPFAGNIYLKLSVFRASSFPVGIRNEEWVQCGFRR